MDGRKLTDAQRVASGMKPRRTGRRFAKGDRNDYDDLKAKIRDADIRPPRERLEKMFREMLGRWDERFAQSIQAVQSGADVPARWKK